MEAAVVTLVIVDGAVVEVSATIDVPAEVEDVEVIDALDNVTVADVLGGVVLEGVVDDVESAPLEVVDVDVSVVDP